MSVDEIYTEKRSDFIPRSPYSTLFVERDFHFSVYLDHPGKY